MPTPERLHDPDRRPRSAWLTLAVLWSMLVVATGCGRSIERPDKSAASSTPVVSVPPSPPGLPVLGIDWGRASVVERPEEAFALPAPDASISSSGSGRSGHPQHFPGQAMMADVARTPAGGLISVGYVYPGWYPTAWTSSDGTVWKLRDMGRSEFTFPVSLAVGRSGAADVVVAVGRSGSHPQAWTSADGDAWTAHPVATVGDGAVAERMTTVAASADGFLAGGSLGPELFERHARFWQSADGVAWQPVPDDPEAFADAEVRSIVAFDAGYVAVGVTGSAQDITGSVAWLSADGRAWTRIDAPDLARGRAVALVEAPWGELITVGSGLNEEEALAWTSPDGRSWSLAPSEPSRQYPGKIRMTDVVVAGDEVMGVGNYVGVQFGTATSWVTRDGRTWTQARNAPVQQQGEIYAVAAAPPGVVAVGSMGAPDNYIPAVLISPAR